MLVSRSFLCEEIDVEISDEALVAACARGDRAALGVLFDRFHLSVVRCLSRFLGAGRSDIDDLVQATFLEVMRSAPGFQGRSAVRTWIAGIALNLARRTIRSEQRRRTHHVELRWRQDQAGPFTDEIAERRQLLQRLAQAVADLPCDLRTAFVMCDLEELPGVEVAQTLGVPAGTVWRRLHHARKQLRQAISGKDPA